MKGINAKIRDFRINKGLSLKDLSDISGYSKGYLSKIERSELPPRIDFLRKIANALEIQITDFFTSSSDNEEPRENFDMVRKEDWPNQKMLSSSTKHYFTSLVKDPKNKYMTPYYFKVGKRKFSRIFKHDSEEFLFVMRGEIIFFYEGKKYILETGDSVYFDARVEHYIHSSTDHQAELIFVRYDYRRF